MTVPASNFVTVFLAESDLVPSTGGPVTWPASWRVEDGQTGDSPENSAPQNETYTFTTPALRQQQESQALTQDAGGKPAMGNSFTWGSYFQSIGVMIFLLVGLWFVLRLIKRAKGPGRPHFSFVKSALSRDDLSLEAQLPLGQNKNISVVRFLNKRLVLGVTDHQITLLDEAAIHEQHSQTPDFQALLDEKQT